MAPWGAQHCHSDPSGHSSLTSALQEEQAERRRLGSRPQPARILSDPASFPLSGENETSGPERFGPPSFGSSWRAGLGASHCLEPGPAA